MILISNYILLEVVQAARSRAWDKAVLDRYWSYYDIVGQIFAIWCDTTASNIGIFSGAIVISATFLTFLSYGFSAEDT